jgi:hypothetical protein
MRLKASLSLVDDDNRVRGGVQACVPGCDLAIECRYLEAPGSGQRHPLALECEPRRQLYFSGFALKKRLK